MYKRSKQIHPKWLFGLPLLFVFFLTGGASAQTVLFEWYVGEKLEYGDRVVLRGEHEVLGAWKWDAAYLEPKDKAGTVYVAKFTFPDSLIGRKMYYKFGIRNSLGLLWMEPGKSREMFVPGALFTGRPMNKAAEEEVPALAALAANYPNPFSTATTLSFTLEAPVPVRVEVFDLQGRKVAALAEGHYAEGRHHVRWTPGALPHGHYLAVLRAGKSPHTRMLTYGVQ